MSSNRVRLERATGRIVSVDTVVRGTELVADAAAGATILLVEDAEAFDEDGGWLQVDGRTAVQYSSVDDDTSTITLAAGLGAAAYDGDGVVVWNREYGEPDTVQRVDVDPDGDDDRSDLVHAIVGDGVQALADGDRGAAGETCVLEREVGTLEWEVVRVSGRPTAARAPRWWDDQFTLAGPTPADLTLTHLPLLRSEDVKLNGLGQLRDVDWTREGQVLTLTEDAAAGDVVDVHYQYIPSPTPVEATPDPAPAPISVGWSAVSGTHTSLALPAGAQVGDLLLVGGMPAGSESDARLTGESTGFPSYARFYTGTATDLTALAIAASSSSFGRSACACIRGGAVAANAYSSGGASAVAAAVAADADEMVVLFAEGVGNTVHGHLALSGAGAAGWTQIGISPTSSGLTALAAWYRLGSSPAVTVTNSMAAAETYLRTVKVVGV